MTPRGWILVGLLLGGACAQNVDEDDVMQPIDADASYPEVMAPPDVGPGEDQLVASGPCEGLDNGAECDDANACTEGDHCEEGFCVAGSVVECADQTNTCDLTTCDPLVGCVPISAPDGAACVALCFEKANCFGGQCIPVVGSEVVCPPSTDPCVDSLLCDPANGTCTLETFKLACPEGTICRPDGGNPEGGKLVCIPLFETLCRPCMGHDQCWDPNFPDEVQLCQPHGDEGSFCSGDCSLRPCPKGYVCAEGIADDGAPTLQCMPESGAVCKCKPQWAPLLLWTDCSKSNAKGSCQGIRVCGTGGLSECDATAPADETCNGIDSDCNGTVDDGVDGGCGIEGACCVGPAECDTLFSDSCVLNGGTFYGPGVDCAETSCGGGAKGACCLASLECQPLDYGTCKTIQGDYKGDGIACDGAICESAPLDGACCFVDGGCTLETVLGCSELNGSYGGHGTACSPEQCVKKGACCMPSTLCFELTQDSCVGKSGAYSQGLQCSDVTCVPPQGVGACCLDGGACVLLKDIQCAEKSGEFLEGENCVGQCGSEEVGACCHFDGACSQVSEDSCEDNAAWKGKGSSCDDSPCAGIPTGACCVPRGCFEGFTAAQCAAFPGEYAGDESTCQDCP